MAGNKSSFRDFKQYARQPRVQYMEEAFDKGMNYTNTPLETGFNRLLFNYDLKESGESLAPRSGVQVMDLAVYPLDGTPLSYDEGRVISGSKACIEDNGKAYRQILTGIASDTERAGTGLYTGEGSVLTVQEESNVTWEIPDVTLKHMTREPLQGEGEVIYFRRPDKAQIHNIPLADLGVISKHVGTFAFGNNYYYFAGPQKLKRTVRSEEEYVPELLPIREVTPKEAVFYGYNMLKANPYTFANTAYSGNIQLQGMLPYDENNNLVMFPQMNQTLTLECFYAGNAANKYKFQWEWKEPSSALWALMATQELELTGLPRLKVEFSPPQKQLMVRLSAYKWNGTAYDTVVETVLTVGFNFDKNSYGSTANLNVETYDLSTATGMTSWKNRLFLYGLAKDPTILFSSDINDPGYFPYPNNIETFDEPIIHATPYMDNLLVFTASKIHMLTLSQDGMSWTKKTLQGNMDIKEWDVHLIQVVKNMVFFKSGNYYYMVVPKANSLTGELTIAPIAKPIENLLDNFSQVVAGILRDIYNYTEETTLLHYYNFLDYEDVHNVYVFQTTEGVLVNVDLLYNTILRVWRVHLYESQNILQPYKQDATKQGSLVSLVKLYQNIGTTETEVHGIQFHQFDKKEVHDLYFPNGFHVLEASGAPVTTDDWGASLAAIHVFKNYQMLDVGYREHLSDYNKRYREMQMKFNNTSQKTLHFQTEFTLDGDVRHSFYTYVAHHETDPLDPNYGLLSLERVPVIGPTSPDIPGNTLLGEHAEDTGAWTLDNSQFPENVLWKVRIPISGKGYAPKMRLLSFNEENYELLNVIWVFRMMNSR